MSDRFDHTLEHKLKTKPDQAEDTAVAVRRIELITGPLNLAGRRRRWSTDDKARILFESLEPGANVSEVARRNGVSPQQLFGWRRAARDQINGDSEIAGVQVVSAPASRPRSSPSKPSGDAATHRKKDASAFAQVVIAAPTRSASTSIDRRRPIRAHKARSRSRSATRSRASAAMSMRTRSRPCSAH